MWFVFLQFLLFINYYEWYLFLFILNQLSIISSLNSVLYLKSGIWNVKLIMWKKKKILFVFTMKIKYRNIYFFVLFILYNLDHLVSQANSPPASARAATGLQTSTQCVKRNEEGQVICMFPHSTVISLIKMREWEMIYCRWHSAKLSKCPQVSLLVFVTTPTPPKGGVLCQT